MNRQLIRRLPAALLACGVLFFTAAAASGASGNSITLNLQGGTSQQKTACHQLNHYTAYKVNTRMYTDGYVDPAPALPDGTWTVKIKIKQCKLGKFVTIAQAHVKGNGVVVNGVKLGHFRFSRVNKTTGFYFARAYYYGYTPTLISTDEHFHVTR